MLICANVADSARFVPVLIFTNRSGLDVNFGPVAGGVAADALLE